MNHEIVFPLLNITDTKNNIIFFTKGLPTLIPRSHFHFLHFIYFSNCIQRIFFQLWRQHAQYFQIETPKVAYSFLLKMSGFSESKCSPKIFRNTLAFIRWEATESLAWTTPIRRW